MKIAIFHNFLDNIGGAEYVALTLARELNADLYTTNLNQEKIKKLGFSEVIPRIKSIGRVPINAPFKQQLAFSKFRKLNLKDKYDLYIVAGDWAMSGLVNNKPNLWYVYSPINEVWQFKRYARTLLIFYKRPIFDIWTYYIRKKSKKYSAHANIIISISQNTKNRIKRFLNKESIVINPPIDTKKYHYKKNGDYWLAVNRLFNNKRVDMQLKAFSLLPEEKLIIVGSYEKSKHFINYANYCKKIKPSNVEIRSGVSQDELIDLYANCKGFITTAIDEDFGMTPLEAMSSGKPVIAPNEGGYKETIINGETGILIDDINVYKLVEVIKRLGKDIKKYPKKYKSACKKQARRFDTEVFIRKIKEQIYSDKK
jgi:glycosyltransferase involved in cell wall biosynthesis